MNTKRLAAGLLFGLSVISAATQAQVPTIRFQDDDIDFLLSSTLAPKSGLFAVNDVLVSVFELPSYSLNGVSQIGAGNEITGIAVLQVASIVGSTVTFKAYSGGFNAVSPVDVVNGGAGGGTTVAMWRNGTAGGADTNLDLDFGGANPQASCTSLANCLQQASLGGLVQVDGFGGDPNEFWSALGSVAGAFDTTIVLGTGGGLQVASFNAAQTTFFNELGPVANQDVLGQTPCVGAGGPLGCVFGPTIAGGISGGGGTVALNAGIVADGAFARSDIDATKLLAVPEPGMLALLGMALFGLGATRRRRQ